MTNCMGEIGQAACILAIGSNTTAAHPVIAVEINKAVRNGAKLIVANPRQIDLVRRASLWLQHQPGTDVALLMGMMRVIVDEGLHDAAFIEADLAAISEDMRLSSRPMKAPSCRRTPKNEIWRLG